MNRYQVTLLLYIERRGFYDSSKQRAGLIINRFFFWFL